MTYQTYQTMVEEALKKTCQFKDVPKMLADAMKYSLLAGGKRLRPVMLLAAYALKKENVDEALPYATALEMIHTYSLIHDDLPAMDNDDMRRGKPTNHVQFGEDIAILAGDGLLNFAYETMSAAALKATDPCNAIHAVEVIARRSGVRGMVAGQVMDVTMEGKKPTEESLVYIHTHKTADLFTAAMEAGLRLAGASEEEVSCGIAFGYHLGRSFQMIDDVLDVVGDEKHLGKRIGMDQIHDKMTWISLVGVDKTREMATSHIYLAIESLGLFGDKGKFLKTLAKTTLDRVQ